MRWLTRSGLLEAAEASYAPDQVRDLIRQYGLPTPDYVVVEHEQDLSKVKLRFPVALKVCSPAILHKTEVGGVRLDIKNRAMLRREYERLKRVFPGEKFAVERMEKKGLEIIVGLTRDATFGLCIMLGLGGILTEALNDVIFRVLPINHADAEEMMKELKARCLLEGFRGMKVDREAIADLLVKVSRLGCDLQDRIEQLDLNPVIVWESGLSVVDAKLVPRGHEVATQRKACGTEATCYLPTLLFPASVAVIGVSKEPQKFGYQVLQNLLQAGFPGNIYPVNPKGGDILGLSVRKALSEIEEPPDLAVITVPAAAVAAVVQDCGEAGVKGLIIITGGFREVGPKGKELENKLREVIARYPMAVIGPNCQGAVNPYANLVASLAIETLIPGFHPGGVALVTQSGSVGSDFLQSAGKDGVGFALWVTVGNKLNLDESDYLAYLNEDSHTTAVACYLEDVTDGEKFLKTVRELRKPLVVLKGGRTSAGQKAAMSHTAALAGNAKIWEGVLKQHGVFQAETTEDLYDLAKGCVYFPRFAGRRLLIVESSGGLGTLASDLADDAGLELPDLDAFSKEELRAFFPSHLALRNPLDTASLEPEIYLRVASTLAMDSFDAVLLIFGDPVRGAAEVVEGFRKHTRNPIVVAFSGGGQIEATERKKIFDLGVPVYPSVARAMKYFQRCAKLRS